MKRAVNTGGILGSRKSLMAIGLLLLSVLLLPFRTQSNLNVVSETVPANSFNLDVFRLYVQLNDFDLSYDAFLKGCEGLNLLNESHSLNKDSIITIVDFSKPSFEERFFVINLNSKSIIFKSLVAHGKNSGDIFATSFSNKVNSLQSCLGFFVTNHSYFGKHGYSLLIDGVEDGVNSNARERAIVIHGADYVSNDYIKAYGRLGRSFGCPAIPEEITKKVIDLIKDGSCLFLYHPSQDFSTDLALNQGINF